MIKLISKAEMQLRALSTKLQDSKFVVNSGGVPLLLTQGRSICWFGRTKTFRVFDQGRKKMDFDREYDLIQYLRGATKTKSLMYH